MTANSMFTAAHQLPIKLIKQINHIVGGIPIKANLQRAINHDYKPSGSIDNRPRTVHILLLVIPILKHWLPPENKNPIAKSLSVPVMERTAA